jgi:hypothetical protein
MYYMKYSHVLYENVDEQQSIWLTTYYYKKHTHNDDMEGKKIQLGSQIEYIKDKI